MLNKLRPFLPHALVVVSLLLISIIYFWPAMQGNVLKQSDITQFRGMSKEVVDFRKIYEEEPLWTNSMFGGMPAFQIAVAYPNNIIKYVDKVIGLGMPRPINTVFISMLGFFILLLAFRVNPWLAGIGAVAFAFSSYSIIILEAGHNSKAHAIAYLAPVLAGIVWTYRGKLWLGGVFTALALALEINANHVQVTYYFAFLVLFYAIAVFIKAIKMNALPAFAKASAILVGAAVIGVLCNTNVLWNTYEYSKETTRGETELTIQPDGSANEHLTTAGLDRDYVTQWSYGIGETFSFLVPNIKGGETAAIGNDPDLLKDVNPQFRQNLAQSNRYWGDQPFTSGPVYMGAIVVLLFLLGAFFIQGPIKWALVASAVLTIALGWGKNYMGLTDFFLDYIPGYNKFRAVTIILSITSLVFPLLGFLFLRKLFKSPQFLEENKKKFLIICGSLSGLLILFLALPETFFNFLSAGEVQSFGSQMASAQNQPGTIGLFVEELKNVRISIFRSDVTRSLMLLIGGSLAMYFFGLRKIKAPVFLSVLFLLVIIDLWSVDKRYLNNEKDRGRYLQWEDKEANQIAFQPQAADMAILQREIQENPGLTAEMESAIGELRTKNKGKRRISEEKIIEERFAILNLATDYRVLKLGNPFNDAGVSYFHKSIGGYHGAKLKRYQELIDFHINDEMARIVNVFQSEPTQTKIESAFSGSNVLNMLNTKYIIYNPEAAPLVNTFALGGAWTVKNLLIADNADDEITRLGEINTANTAVVDQRFSAQTENYSTSASSGAVINTLEHLPNYIKYRFNSSSAEAVIFSEIYYDKGWQAYLDGNPVPHFRANYVLRGMIVPAGAHEIEFRFEPETYAKASLISTISSVLLLLLVIGAIIRKAKLVKEEKDNFANENV